MQKIICFLLVMLVVTLTCSSTVNAFDIKYTDDTYAREASHWLYFDGYVGVRGADWIKPGAYWCWPKFSRITWVIPGMNNEVLQVTANSSSDTQARSGFLRIWNNPVSVTRSYWR